MTDNHQVVSYDDWILAQQQLLASEKEFNRLRNQLSAERRALPWERFDKSCVFDGPAGRGTLAELFAGRSQLAAYHFMLGPGWDFPVARAAPSGPTTSMVSMSIWRIAT